MRTHWGNPLFPLLCGALFLLSFSQSVIAVPAAPVLHTLSQPDGTTFRARQWGDENLHGWETEEGFTVVRDERLNRWTYAEHAADGRLISTSRLAGKDKLPAGLSKRIRPRGAALQEIEMKRLSRELQPQSLAPQGLSDASLQFVVSPSGAGNIPVILINFNNTPTSYTPSDFNTLLFGTASFSMKDYYTEVSYGAFTVSAGPGGVVGWYTAAKDHDYYGYANGMSRAAALVKEAVIAADATGFNFAPYDQDGDCYVDVVNIVHQGTGTEASGNNNDIWSHRWELRSGTGSPYTTNDNCTANPSQKVKVNDYVIQPEVLWGGQQTMGVFAHEYGHALGLPDLYDTDGSSEGIGNWSLMAGGSWNYASRAGDRPAHPDAWCKYYLGWVAPTAVSGTLTNEAIAQAATSGDIYQLRSGSPLSGEYFLIENRQKSGFDEGLPDSGLLIWHIDGSKISSLMGSNTVNNAECYPPSNCTVNHFGVALIQADNLWNLEKGTNRGDAGDTYKSAGNATFDVTSSPNSNLYNGSASNISVTNIGVSGATMYATLQYSQLTVQFQSGSSSGSEATTPAIITVNLSAVSGQTVTVNYATNNGTAAAGSDYTTTNGTLTFNPGETSKTINVPITNDSVVESSETFTVSLSSPTNATLGATATHTYTINDDDSYGSIQLNSAAYSVNENGAAVTITATRTGGSSGTVGVSYGTANGTAAAGSDYTAASGTLSWAAGDTANKTFTVSISNDALDEANETFTVTLGAPTGGASLGSPATATVTITDDDPAPPVQFEAAASTGSESVTPAAITVTLSAVSGQTVTVNYATANGTAAAGSDYTTTNGTLTFAPGETSKTINVPITNDSTVESSETFTVSLSSPTNATLGATTTHTYTINDDDSYGSIQLSAAAYSVNENGAAVTITATRTGGSGGTVGVIYGTSDGTAAAGFDYTAASGTLSWAAGDMANKTFTVSISNDALDEANETFTVSLSAPTGGASLGSPAMATVTITDDDPAPPVQFEAAASTGSESVTPAAITVTLSAVSGQTVTVNYATANGTAVAGSDYATTNGTLTFALGETSKTINVPITNDSAVESSETFTVSLSSPTNATLGATTTHTYTINDDDSYGSIQLSSAAYSVNENGAAVTITATRTGGSGGTVGVSYGTANGTAAAGSDYTAASGTLSWAAGDTANKTFTVSISNDALDEANETFTVTLLNPMGGAMLGNPSSATVTIADDDGNVPIVLNMLKNPDFEEGHVNWKEYSRGRYEVINEEPLYAFSGNWSAMLGGSTRRSYLYQDVKVPSDAISASLNFWFNIVSEESPNDMYDIMKLEVRRPSDNALLSRLDTLSNLDVTGGWAQSRSYDLMPFRGQDIRLRVKAKNNTSNETTFYLDDLAVTVSRKINLDSPNGGETIAAGTLYNIQFRTVSEVSTVKIKYTLNNGRTWKTIAVGETGTRYPWSVPVTAQAKTKCRIKVIGYDAHGKRVAKDDSDGTFTIAP